MNSSRLNALFLMLLCVMLFSCISGASLVSSSDSYTILVSYEPKGTFPENVSWYLIQTEAGYKILERQQGHSDAVIDECWKDTKGRHFVAWVELLGAQSTAFEYIVPDDLTQPVLRYTYPGGSYAVVESNGAKRPVPHKRPGAPQVRLIPMAKDQAF